MACYGYELNWHHRLCDIRTLYLSKNLNSYRYDYSPYQGPTKVFGTTINASLLTIGRYYNHAATGLELALYRAYDPELGRWMSEDPLEDAEIAEGPNLYGFVGNGPVGRSDQLGLAWTTCKCVLDANQWRSSYVPPTKPICTENIVTCDEDKCWYRCTCDNGDTVATTRGSKPTCPESFTMRVGPPYPPVWNAQ